MAFEKGQRPPKKGQKTVKKLVDVSPAEVEAEEAETTVAIKEAPKEVRIELSKKKFEKAIAFGWKFKTDKRDLGNGPTGWKELTRELAEHLGLNDYNKIDTAAEASRLWGEDQKEKRSGNYPHLNEKMAFFIRAIGFDIPVEDED